MSHHYRSEYGHGRSTPTGYSPSSRSTGRAYSPQSHRSVEFPDYEVGGGAMVVSGHRGGANKYGTQHFPQHSFGAGGGGEPYYAQSSPNASRIASPGLAAERDAGQPSLFVLKKTIACGSPSDVSCFIRGNSVGSQPIRAAINMLEGDVVLGRLEQKQGDADSYTLPVGEVQKIREGCGKRQYRRFRISQDTFGWFNPRGQSGRRKLFGAGYHSIMSHKLKGFADANIMTIRAGMIYQDPATHHSFSVHSICPTSAVALLATIEQDAVMFFGNRCRVDEATFDVCKVRVGRRTQGYVLFRVRENNAIVAHLRPLDGKSQESSPRLFTDPGIYIIPERSCERLVTHDLSSQGCGDDDLRIAHLQENESVFFYSDRFLADRIAETKRGGLSTSQPGLAMPLAQGRGIYFLYGPGNSWDFVRDDHGKPDIHDASAPIRILSMGDYMQVRIVLPPKKHWSYHLYGGSYQMFSTQSDVSIFRDLVQLRLKFSISSDFAYIFLKHMLYLVNFTQRKASQVQATRAQFNEARAQLGPPEHSARDMTEADFKLLEDCLQRPIKKHSEVVTLKGPCNKDLYYDKRFQQVDCPTELSEDMSNGLVRSGDRTVGTVPPNCFAITVILGRSRSGRLGVFHSGIEQQRRSNYRFYSQGRVQIDGRAEQFLGHFRLIYPQIKFQFELVTKDRFPFVIRGMVDLRITDPEKAVTPFITSDLSQQSLINQLQEWLFATMEQIFRDYIESNDCASIESALKVSSPSSAIVTKPTKSASTSMRYDLEQRIKDSCAARGINTETLSFNGMVSTKVQERGMHRAAELRTVDHRAELQSRELAMDGDAFNHRHEQRLKNLSIYQSVVAASTEVAGGGGSAVGHARQFLTAYPQEKQLGSGSEHSNPEGRSSSPQQRHQPPSYDRRTMF